MEHAQDQKAKQQGKHHIQACRLSVKCQKIGHLGHQRKYKQSFCIRTSGRGFIKPLHQKITHHRRSKIADSFQKFRRICPRCQKNMAEMIEKHRQHRDHLDRVAGQPPAFDFLHFILPFLRYETAQLQSLRRLCTPYGQIVR